MLKLEINGRTYSFNAGFGFLKEINKTHTSVTDNGDKQNDGLAFKIIGIKYDQNIEDLRDVLLEMNKGQTPVLTKSELESYLESADDVDSLYDQVIDFLSNANCTKSTAKRALEFGDKAVQEQKKKIEMELKK